MSILNTHASAVLMTAKAEEILKMTKELQAWTYKLEILDSGKFMPTHIKYGAMIAVELGEFCNDPDYHGELLKMNDAMRNIITTNIEQGYMKLMKLKDEL